MNAQQSRKEAFMLRNPSLVVHFHGFNNQLWDFIGETSRGEHVKVICTSKDLLRVRPSMHIRALPGNFKLWIQGKQIT